MAGIAIAYSQQASPFAQWNIVFEQFTSTDLPRQYANTAGFSRSQTGALLQQGPRYSQKHLWTIDCILTTPKAYELDALYKAWDYDRSTGKSVAVGLLDKTFGPDLSATATFTSAPTFTYAGPGYTIVSFAMAQV